MNTIRKLYLDYLFSPRYMTVFQMHEYYLDWQVSLVIKGQKRTSLCDTTTYLKHKIIPTVFSKLFMKMFFEISICIIGRRIQWNGVQTGNKWYTKATSHNKHHFYIPIYLDSFHYRIYCFVYFCLQTCCIIHVTVFLRKFLKYLAETYSMNF